MARNQVSLTTNNQACPHWPVPHALTTQILNLPSAAGLGSTSLSLRLTREGSERPCFPTLDCYGQVQHLQVHCNSWPALRLQETTPVKPHNIHCVLTGPSCAAPSAARLHQQRADHRFLASRQLLQRPRCQARRQLLSASSPPRTLHLAPSGGDDRGLAPGRLRHPP
jgi:hypothetical protein